MIIPDKTRKRINRHLSKYRNVLKAAKDKNPDKNDSIKIITAMLTCVFGYDRRNELVITERPYHLIVKSGSCAQFMLECGTLGAPLKDKHFSFAAQAVPKQKISWFVLTNGISWEIYKIKFEKPLRLDLVYNFNFLEISLQNTRDLEKLFILSRECVYREEFYRKAKYLNRHVLGAFILSEPVISLISQEIQKYSEGFIIKETAIESIIARQILKSGIFEGDEALKSFSKVNGYYREIKKLKAET